MVGDKDIYLLVGCCKSRSEIQDFRPTETQRRPRYAAMIAPPWVRGNTDSQLWKSQPLADSAMTGDPWAYFRAAYCSGLIDIVQFYRIPSSAEVRALNDAYRKAGITFGEDPIGMTQTYTSPVPIGRSAVICSDNNATHRR